MNPMTGKNSWILKRWDEPPVIPQEEYQDLLEEYMTIRVEGYCPAEWNFIDWLITEVRKQRVKSE